MNNRLQLYCQKHNIIEFHRGISDHLLTAKTHSKT